MRLGSRRARRNTKLLLHKAFESSIIRRDANHVKALVSGCLGLHARRAVNAALLAGLARGGEDSGNGVLEFIGEDTVKNGMANVIACIFHVLAIVVGEMVELEAYPSQRVR